MVKEFIVHKDRYFQDKKGKMHAPGERVMCDDADPFISSQLFKLVPVETTYDYGYEPPKAPVVEDVLAQADKIIEKHKEETPVLKGEPPKAVKPEKKPAQDIPKEKAETMLDRVKDFVEQQEKDKKK